MCNVDLATGRLSLSAVDFSLAGRIPLVEQRHYRSTNMWLGDLGHGWSHPLGVRLWEQDGAFWFRGADGRRIPFVCPAAGKPAVQPSERSSLHLFPTASLPSKDLRAELPGGALALQQGAEATLLFDARGVSGLHPLRAIVDRSENVVRIIPGN